MIYMIETRYECIPDELFVNYLKFLVGKVFKILPISESEPDTLKDYLESLILELSGSIQLISKIKCDGSFISLLSTLQYFIDNECTNEVYRREVFKCISIINKLQKRYNFD